MNFFTFVYFCSLIVSCHAPYHQDEKGSSVAAGVLNASDDGGLTPIGQESDDGFIRPIDEEPDTSGGIGTIGGGDSVDIGTDGIYRQGAFPASGLFRVHLYTFTTDFDGVKELTEERCYVRCTYYDGCVGAVWKPETQSCDTYSVNRCEPDGVLIDLQGTAWSLVLGTYQVVPGRYDQIDRNYNMEIYYNQVRTEKCKNFPD